VALAALSVGCGTGEVCTSESSGSLEVVAGAACPTDARAVAAELETRSPGTSIEARSLLERAPEPALTVCWYRLVFMEHQCLPSNERRALLAEAEALHSTVTSANEGIVACDPEGYLFGKVLPAPRTADDPEALVPPDPALCPPEVATTSGPNPRVLDAFVGADHYPARVICTYETSETTHCAHGGVPSFGLN
jgi:hypothetical protein